MQDLTEYYKNLNKGVQNLQEVLENLNKDKIFRSPEELKKASDEYAIAANKHRVIVSANRSKQIVMRNSGKGHEFIPTPTSPPSPILVPMVYDKEGNFYGRAHHPDEIPEGHIVKWEKYRGG